MAMMLSCASSVVVDWRPVLSPLSSDFCHSYRPPALQLMRGGLSLRKNLSCKISRWRILCQLPEGEHKEDEARKPNDGGSHVSTETAGDSVTQSSQDTSIPEKESEEPKLTSGSPLPGVKPADGAARLPKEVVDVLRDQVFSFDTFFVTGQEPYEGGVLFQGNLRGQAAKSYSKLNRRLQDKFGEQYKLFLLENPTDERPVAVVVPKESLEPTPAAVPEWFAAGIFGLVSIVTVTLRNAPALQLTLLGYAGDAGLLLQGLFGASVTISVLMAHEAGHRYAANKVGAVLGIPYFIPSWQLGSFGAITRITNILTQRQDLLEVAAAGPLAGVLVGLPIVLLGLLLPPGEGQGIIVDASIFHDSFLVGGLAKLILGDVLQDGAKVAINPIVLAAWAGLLINSINSIPVGELDGGRVAQALWGRKVWSRFTGVSVALLGLGGFINDVPLYWVVLVLFLQRGPITPQSDEITRPDDTHVAIGIAVLLLGLLIYFPFPFSFSPDLLAP